MHSVGACCQAFCCLSRSWQVTPELTRTYLGIAMLHQSFWALGFGRCGVYGHARAGSQYSEARTDNTGAIAGPRPPIRFTHCRSAPVLISGTQ